MAGREGGVEQCWCDPNVYVMRRRVKRVMENVMMKQVIPQTCAAVGGRMDERGVGVEEEEEEMVEEEEE